ncbi:MAG: single-stranded-DNA-specific exonuclease RecJ [Patescibacteria group bacterium]
MAITVLSKKKPQNSAELKKVLLSNRGITYQTTFFSPPELLTISAEQVGIDQMQLNQAVARIQAAIDAKEKVVIYGDYDADGISATAVLWQALHAAGAQITPFIPKRDVHGYGLSIAGIDEVEREYAPDLVITVDNGIVAAPAIVELKKRGIEVIITDHHQPEQDKALRAKITKNSVAQVHTTQLCGTGVAWFLAREFSEEMAVFGMDLVGLATIADQVPLVDWNRAAALHGLEALRTTQRVGLLALADQAKVDLKSLTSTGVGYTLAPRINAMGRLAHGLDALRLLCTNQVVTANRLAAILSETNVDRQELTSDQFELALSLAADQSDWPVTIVAHQDFHEGVVGLLAGRLVEKLHKPALVIQIGEQLAKGSARSVAGVNVVELLRNVREHLVDVGGHPMAAGFSLEPDKLEQFIVAISTAATERIGTEPQEETVAVECELDPELVTLDTIEMIETFAPFGMANSEPLFLINNVPILRTRVFGREEQHCSMQFASVGQTKVEAIFWNESSVVIENHRAGGEASIVGKLSINNWKNRRSAQVIARSNKGGVG